MAAAPTRPSAASTAANAASYLGSSAARADIIANAKFDIGYGMLPYWPNVPGAPQNSIIGGATLWVLKGRPTAEYKGVARSSRSCRGPDVQAWWHQIPAICRSPAGLRSDARAGFYDRNPGTDISIEQMTLHPPTENRRACGSAPSC